MPQNDCLEILARRVRFYGSDQNVKSGEMNGGLRLGRNTGRYAAVSEAQARFVRKALRYGVDRVETMPRTAPVKEISVENYLNDALMLCECLFSAARFFESMVNIQSEVC